MPSDTSGASASHHAPLERSSFLRIRLTRDPEEAFAAVCRILFVGKVCDDNPADTLERCSEWIGGHGAESVTLADGSELHYVNKGDTYDATLCFASGRGFFVSSWGDEVEQADRRREQDEGERRCSYCSEWTDVGEPCGSCGRDPATGEPWPEPLRHVRLETGHTLRTWDTGRTTGRGMMGRTRIGYELRLPAGDVLFRGDDFGPSPLHADDSDDALRALVGFLTLRPGDTDADYFADYSAEQRAFAESSECEHLQWLYSEQGGGTFVDVDDEGSADA